MTTRYSKTYFFTGVFGPLGRLFKKGNKPNQKTYQEFTDSLSFINDFGDTAKTTEQGMVKKSSNVQFAAGTDNDINGFAVYPLNSQIKTLIALYYTKTEDNALLAAKGTTNYLHGNGEPGSLAVTIATTYLDDSTGNIWYNASGSTWTKIFTLKDIVIAYTNWSNGFGVPTGIPSNSGYYLNDDNGDIYYCNISVVSPAWSLIFSPITLFYLKTENDKRINILETELTSDFLLAYGVGYTIPFPILSATQCICIEKIVAFLSGLKYTDANTGTPGNNRVIFTNDPLNPLFTIKKSLFTNDNRCELAVQDDQSTESARILKLNTAISAYQISDVGQPFTGSTAHVKLKIYYRLVDLGISMEM